MQKNLKADKWAHYAKLPRFDQIAKLCLLPLHLADNINSDDGVNVAVDVTVDVVVDVADDGGGCTEHVNREAIYYCY